MVAVVQLLQEIKVFKTSDLGDFPGGPVVKTPCFHCLGHGFDPWSVRSNNNNNKTSDLVPLQIPPAPPRPDFDASREKLQKLGEGEGSMTKEEFTKMKQELEAYVIFVFNCAYFNAFFVLFVFLFKQHM